jgi:hypothetical protein
MPKINTPGYDKTIASFGIIVCCGLLLLAIPRFIASLYALYPEAALQQAKKNFPPDVCETSIAHLEHALAWYENPEYWQAQALFYLALSNNTTPFPPFAEKQAWRKKAQLAIMQGLKRSPVDPIAWFRLATVDKMLNAPSQQIISDLRLSFYAGRAEQELVIPRLFFSYNYYGEFNEEMRLLWQKQLPIAWAFQPTRLVEFVVLHPTAKQLVEAAFIYSPDDFEEFSRALASYLKKNALHQAK